MEDPRNPDPIAALADFLHYMYPRAECINIKYGALIDAYVDPDWDGYGAISGGKFLFTTKLQQKLGLVNENFNIL